MTEPRPRPKYGEYASSQDQAKAIAVSLPRDTSVGAQRQPQPSEHGHAFSPTRRTGPSARPRPSWDTALTSVLLGIGLLSVLMSVPGMAQLPATIQQAYALQGYSGSYGPIGLASAIGLAINISQIMIWAVTCALSVFALRKRRPAFYIPIAGGLLSAVVVMVLLVVAMVNDPGLVAHLSSLQK
ncbi:MAG: DUF6264 family protein [Lacisediminihabitans sp.]